jgi:hypothetical protein
MDEGVFLKSTIAEYESVVEGLESQSSDELIAARLSLSCDWTERGAEVIVGLARDYGAFMLRNALALAIVLGREDGGLGF